MGALDPMVVAEEDPSPAASKLRTSMMLEEAGEELQVPRGGIASTNLRRTNGIFVLFSSDDI